MSDPLFAQLIVFVVTKLSYEYWQVTAVPNETTGAHVEIVLEPTGAVKVTASGTYVFG